MPPRVRVFYAYPNYPPSIGETTSSALSKLNENSDIKRNSIRFTKWADNPVSGSRLIKNILGKVDRSQIFSCDLTYPNPNVSFELGYAIARFKRIFTTLNPGIANAAKDYKRFYFSSLNMGYAEYDNHEDLADRFLSERPWQSLDQTLLDRRDAAAAMAGHTCARTDGTPVCWGFKRKWRSVTAIGREVYINQQRKQSHLCPPGRRHGSVLGFWVLRTSLAAERDIHFH